MARQEMITAITNIPTGRVDTAVIEIPRRSKTIECAGCSREITVADRVCMAYCAKCSADQGKKR